MTRQGSRFALTASPRRGAGALRLSRRGRFSAALQYCADPADRRRSPAPRRAAVHAHALGFLPGWVKDPARHFAPRHGARRDRRRATGVQRGLPLSPLPGPGLQASTPGSAGPVGTRRAFLFVRGPAARSASPDFLRPGAAPTAAKSIPPACSPPAPIPRSQRFRPHAGRRCARGPSSDGSGPAIGRRPARAAPAGASCGTGRAARRYDQERRARPDRPGCRMSQTRLAGSAIEGFLLGAGLIVAIGAQTPSFSSRASHAVTSSPSRRFAPSPMCCSSRRGLPASAACVEAAPSLLVVVMTLVGAVFLAAYGGLAFWRALRPAA